MTRPTVKHLITSPDGLGYCCVWFFFTRFRQTQLVADRLGLTDRAVRACKARVRSGEEQCPGKENCMHQKVTMQLRPRAKPAEEA